MSIISAIIGLLSGGASSIGTLSMLAGTSGNYRGYLSASYQTITGQTACGSLTGSVSNGTIAALYSNTVSGAYHLIYLGPPSVDPTSIDIDGVNYALTPLTPGSGLYPYEIATHPTFNSGQTYAETVYA